MFWLFSVDVWCRFTTCLHHVGCEPMLSQYQSWVSQIMHKISCSKTPFSKKKKVFFLQPPGTYGTQKRWTWKSSLDSSSNTYWIHHFCLGCNLCDPTCSLNIYTALAPNIAPNKNGIPKGNDRLPTIRFSGVKNVSFREGTIVIHGP